MPIQVKCARCGLAMQVKDELAGRTGKCPKCKAEIKVPAGIATKPISPKPTRKKADEEDLVEVEAIEEEEFEYIDEDDDRPAKKKRSREDDEDRPSAKKKRSREEDDEDDEDDRPARKKRSRDEEDEDDDEDRPSSKKKRSREEDDEDDEDDDRRSKKKKKPKRSSGPVDTSAAAFLGVGAGLLVLLGLTTLFNFWWVSVTLPKEFEQLARQFGGSTNSTPDTAMYHDGRGITIMVLSIVAGVFAIVALVITVSSKSQDIADTITAVCCAVSGGWGAVVVLWFLGILLHWLIHVLPNNGKDIGGGIMTTKITISVYPGLGWLLGIMAAGAVVGLFGLVASQRERIQWFFYGLGAGALIGLILVLADVRPWDKYRGIFTPAPSRQSSGSLF